MKRFSYLSLVLCAILALSGCSGSGELEQMIPADALGLVVVDVPSVVEKAGLKSDGKLLLPASLQQVLDESEGSSLASALTVLPHLGLDTGSKAYGFMTDKTYGMVWLASLSDAEQARSTLARSFGADFAESNGVQCIYQGDYLCAIDDNVLFVGRFNRPVEKDKAVKAALNILKKKNAKAVDTDQLKAVLRSEGDVHARLGRLAVQSMLRRSAGYREIAQKMPLVEVFTQSDFEAVDIKLTLNEQTADLALNVEADEGSDYNKLLTMLLAKPTASVLKAVPNSMEYMVSLSVNGQRLVALPQVKMMLQVFDRMPYINRLGIAGMLSLVDGPVVLAVAQDPHLAGEWNAVVSARSSASSQLIKQISTFATLLGQAPEVWEGEHIYQYDNKMIKLGTIDNDVFYAKMLDYDLPEGSFYDDETVRHLFESSPVAVYAHTGKGVFDFGLTDNTTGSGKFTANEGSGGAALALLEALCELTSSKAYDDMLDSEDDSELDAAIGRAIDEFQPMP